MPDTAVAEPVITDAGAAEPAAVEELPNPSEVEGSPDPSQPGAEGSDSTDTEGSQYDAEIEAELQAVVDQRVADELAKREGELTERVKQRTKEADDGEGARTQLYATAESTGQTALQAIIASHQQGEPLDVTETQTRLREIASGVIASVSKGYEGAVKSMVETALPEQTDAEKEALEPLLYDFRRNGRFEGLLPKVIELSIARKDAEIAELKKQVGDRKGLAAAAEKLAKIRGAVGPSEGAQTPKGKAQATDTSDQARQARLAAGQGTAEDDAWLQRTYPG